MTLWVLGKSFSVSFYSLSECTFLFLAEMANDQGEKFYAVRDAVEAHLYTVSFLNFLVPNIQQQQLIPNRCFQRRSQGGVSVFRRIEQLYLHTPR